VSIRQRLYPASSDVPALERYCSDARFVWNVALEQANLWSRQLGPSPNLSERSKQLTEARQDTWLGEGSADIQERALRDLDRAFRNWWRNPSQFGRPTWRAKGKHEGFGIHHPWIYFVNDKWAQISVPKVGRVRVRLTRPWPEIEGCKSARVKMDSAGRWWVTFPTPQPPVIRDGTGAAVGIDLGIAASVTTSDGHHLRMPALMTAGEQQRKRRLERKRSRQVKGSNRRTATNRAIGRLACREVDRRNDWIERSTTSLVHDHDFIAIEDLRVANMVRSGKGKRGLNRSIHSQGWGTFRQRLTDKASAASSPVEVVAINPANTSRRCAECGHTAKENRESQAVFLCLACGHRANADVNAAINILAAGLAVSGRGGTPHDASHSGPTKRQPLAGVSA
jgi:putative transposase